MPGAPTGHTAGEGEIRKMVWVGGRQGLSFTEQVSGVPNPELLGS